MSLLKDLAEGLNEMYIQRDKVPEIMDRLNNFVKDNVMQDLIDLGCRVNQVKKHHSPKLALVSVFFPRTVANFNKFDKDMTNFVDDEPEVQVEAKPQKINGNKRSKKKKSKENYFGIDNLEYVKRN